MVEFLENWLKILLTRIISSLFLWFSMCAEKGVKKRERHEPEIKNSGQRYVVRKKRRNGFIRHGG